MGQQATLTRLAALGATTSEIASLTLGYQAISSAAAEGLDRQIAGLDSTGLMSMLTLWRAGFTFGVLPYPPRVAVETGSPLDDVYAISAGTGQKLGVGGGGSGSAVFPITAGNLGATYSLNMESNQEVALQGTLNTNCAMTTTGWASGYSRAELTLTIGGAYSLTINGTAVPNLPTSGLVVIVVDTFNGGTTVNVSVPAGVGPTPWITLAAWVTSTAYVTGPPASVVSNNGSTIVCILAHTSSSAPVNPNGMLADTTHWAMVAQQGGTGVTATQQSGSSYTFVLADAGTVVEGTGTSPQSFIIPPHSSVAWPSGPYTATVIEVFQYGTGQITIVAGAGVTLRSDGSRAHTAAQYATIGLRCRATDEWVLSGDLA
jgi:hypothetical protein